MLARRSYLLGSMCLALSLVSCGNNDVATSGGKHYPDYRYRMTVEVDTPEGLKSGSSVIEVSTFVSGPESIPTPNIVSHKIRGEAVVVDLGERGKLFALLDRADNMFFRAATSAAPTLGKNVFDNRMQQLATLDSRPLVIPRHYYRNHDDDPEESDAPTAYPKLVTFSNFSNPSSVSQVSADHLDDEFGEGVSLRSIKVQKTDGAISSGILSILP